MTKGMCASLAAAVLLLDQGLGGYLMTELQPSEARWEQWVCHPMLSFNPSIAWGALPVSQDAPLLGAGLGVVAAVVAGWSMLGMKRDEAWAWALLLGGFLVGIVDRLRFHAAMDFVACRVAGRAVTFNIGDLAITIGLVGLLGIYAARLCRKRQNNVPDLSRESQGSV